MFAEWKAQHIMEYELSVEFKNASADTSVDAPLVPLVVSIVPLSCIIFLAARSNKASFFTPLIIYVMHVMFMWCVMYMCIYTCMHACKHVCMYVYMYLCMYVCMYVFM